MRKRVSFLSILVSMIFLVILQISIKPAVAGPISSSYVPVKSSVASGSAYLALFTKNPQPNGNSSNAHGKHSGQLVDHSVLATQTVLPISFITNQIVQVSTASLYSAAPITPKSSTAISISAISINASASAPHGVAIKLVGANQINLADPIVLSGNLKDLTTGTGVPDKSIKFFISNTLLGQARTNNDGSYQVKINKDLAAGNYQLTASFTGAHMLAAASTNISLNILPAIVEVQTIPAVEGIPFMIDGRSFTSGPDGMAKIQIAQAGQYQLDLLLDQYKNPSQQVEFGRWTEETAQTSRVVQVPDNHVIQVGLNVYHKVSMKFLDLSGYPVDPSRISSITIRSIQGDIFTLKPGDTPWLPAIRTARRQAGLEKSDLLYSVNSVVIDGSNVVNSAQQRFFAKPDDTWSVSLLLYSMHITAKDALLRKSVGTSINLILPDGQSVNYPLDKSGVLDLHALARGSYKVVLLGASGIGTSTPVALSRDQAVNLNIVTKPDMIIFFSASGLIAIGLIIYGRPWLLLYISKSKNRSYWQAKRDFLA